MTKPRRTESNPAVAVGSIGSSRIALGGGAQPNGPSPFNIADDGSRYFRYGASTRQTSPGAYGVGLAFQGSPTAAAAGNRFGGNRAASVAQSLGLHTVNEDRFAGRGRWLVYAEANGQIVGLNMTSSDQDGLQSAGWTAEGASAVTDNAHAGIGWREGDMLASFGYMRHEFRAGGDLPVGPGQGRRSDSMVGFSLIFHPR